VNDNHAFSDDRANSGGNPFGMFILMRRLNEKRMESERKKEWEGQEEVDDDDPTDTAKINHRLSCRLIELSRSRSAANTATPATVPITTCICPTLPSRTKSL
jgi:hypothetical protein